MRKDRIFAYIQRAFWRGHDRFGMRVIDFSLQRDHIHLIVEAEDRLSLTRGLQGLSVRLPRAVNRALSRAGRVFADRYHDRLLRTPSEVRKAVNDVRNNFNRHEAKAGRAVHPFFIDPYSSVSGEASTYMVTYDLGVPVVATPRTWLLRSLAA